MGYLLAGKLVDLLVVFVRNTFVSILPVAINAVVVFERPTVFITLQRSADIQKVLAQPGRELLELVGLLFLFKTVAESGIFLRV